jgi:hypothetical protein
VSKAPRTRRIGDAARLVRERVRLAWLALFPGRRLHYGDDGTVQRTGVLNVELDRHGRVVAVWFRCALLPFEQRTVEWERVKHLRTIYDAAVLPAITAIDLMRHAPPAGTPCTPGKTIQWRPGPQAPSAFWKTVDWRAMSEGLKRRWLDARANPRDVEGDARLT